MIEINSSHISRLIDLEANVNYASPPANGNPSFTFTDGDSPILISAPHGAKTHRETGKDGYHEEDEYTAGMAMLLGKVCSVPVIATISQSDSSDPNYYDESKSDYKQKLREIIATKKIKYVIDLHGAKKKGEKNDRLADSQLIDLGLGTQNDYLPETVHEKLIQLIESRLGVGTTDRKGKPGFPATRNTIAAFCRSLNTHAVQIEMRPQLRIASRKTDASSFTREGDYKAPDETLIGMLQALVDFIEYLKEN